MPPKRKAAFKNNKSDKKPRKRSKSDTGTDSLEPSSVPSLDATQPPMKKAKENKKERKIKFDVDETLKQTDPPKNLWLFDLLTEDAWQRNICGIFHGDTFQNLEQVVKKVYDDKKAQVFPPKELVFNAFNLTPFNEVKIVILGQDPYHDDKQAHGLSFSVPRGVDVPRSLKNIYKELTKDTAGFQAPDHGCLEKWARDGVLLLNATLTVEAHKPNSHAKLGWQDFTDHVIAVLSRVGPPMVFILWGGFAHKKAPLIDESRHGVIKTAHPSPLSVTKFMGCRCFSQANQWLKEHGRQPVDWAL